MRAPCMIIVGEVVSLRKKLNWYERLPLFGRRVVVTRTLEKSSALRRKLESLGAEVLEFPAIEIGPPPLVGPLKRAAREAAGYDWILFASAHGVEAFFAALARLGRDARSLGGAKIASVGPATTDALREKGVLPDLEPARYESSAMAETFRKRYRRLDGKRILVPSASLTPPDLERALRRLGADVRRVIAYSTRMPKAFPASLRGALDQGVDFITFTSASTARHFVLSLGKPAARRVSRRACLASIGPVTSRELREAGLKVGCQAKEFTVDGLVSAMKNKGSYGLPKRQA